MRNQLPPIVSVETGRVLRLNQKCFSEVLSDSGDVELPFCLPGEEVEFEKVQYPKKVNNYFKKVIKPSLERQDALCKHFTTCGGCLLQHVNENFYKEFKSSLLNQAFINNNLNPYIIQPIKVVPVAQRRRANLEAVKKGDKLFMGFHRLQSHQVVDMEECPVLTKPLQDSIPYLRQAMDNLLEPFQKSNIFVLEIDGLVDIGIEIQGVNKISEPQRAMLKDIAIQANWTRLQFRHRKFYDLILQKEPINAQFGKLAIPVDPWAFLQASSIAESWMNDVIKQTLDESGPQTSLLDLFSGRGTFSGTLLNYGHVDAFEGNSKAIALLSSAGKGLSLNAQVRDLFEKPLSVKALNNYSAAVIDPPRAGADSQVQQLAESLVPTVIYISCNPETFARDAKTLEDGGYSLQAAYPIDQFLWSAHLEVVGVFKKS
ncbi:MAG: hypothetical protein NT128_04705 [Proteobacteria bacterium]|nr:hypothetical protein [Pseudomonadota bacterium]